MEKKAEYQISSSVDDKILEIVVKGKLTKSSSKEMTNKFSDIVEANKIQKILVDIRALEGRLSVTEIYERVRTYPPHMYKSIFAMVDIPDNADHQMFHETTAANAGMKVKWFADMDAARAWLKSK